MNTTILIPLIVVEDILKDLLEIAAWTDLRDLIPHMWMEVRRRI
jgi:hypothetical protein